MKEHVRAALATVARRMQAHDVRFALGGSGVLWALGLTGEIRDIDLMVHADDEERALAAVADLQPTHTREGTDLWASAWFVQLAIEGVDVDLIGGMAFRHPAGVAQVPLRSGGTVEVGPAPADEAGPADPDEVSRAGDATWLHTRSVRIPYADPALWWAIYRQYKPEKAALLERVVDVEAREAVAGELRLPT